MSAVVLCVSIIPNRSAADAQALHRMQHRVFTYVGFAPAIYRRFLTADEESGHLRQRAATVGAAYRHHFSRWLGLHVGTNVGVGRTNIGFAAPSGECCFEFSKNVGPSFSLDIEIAPVFGPLGPVFYLSPGLMTRVFFPTERSATFPGLSTYEGTPVTVSFPSPMAATGVRLSLGVMLGAHQEFDLAAGVDAGYGYGVADGYLGLFLRFGVAFGDLASD